MKECCVAAKPGVVYGVKGEAPESFRSRRQCIIGIDSIFRADWKCTPNGTRRMLFMPAGWFGQNGLKTGDIVTAFKPITQEAAIPILAKRTAVANEGKRLTQLTASVARMRGWVNREKMPNAYNSNTTKEMTAGSASLVAFASTEIESKSIVVNEGFVLSTSSSMKKEVYSSSNFQPLSIAYIDAAGRIVRLENVTEYREDQISNDASASHVVVTSLGWFKSHGVKTGDTVSFKDLTDKRRNEMYAQNMKEAGERFVRYLREEKKSRIALARLKGEDADNLLQAGKIHHHAYLCRADQSDNDSRRIEEGQNLLYVQSRGADGSINAIYDLLVADFDNKIVHNARMQMTGRKDADGAYTFSPVKTLKTAQGYKVNSIRAWGNLGELEVNFSGSKCGTAEQLPILVKEADHGDQWSAGVKFNLSHRSLQLAEIFYGNVPGKGGELAVRPDPYEREPGLGMVLIASGAALPGETAKTSHAVWITDYGNQAERYRFQQNGNTHKISGSSPYYGKREIYYADKETGKNCAGMPSTFACVGNLKRNKDFKETASDNRHYTDILTIKAAHSRKVAYAPDFAPQHELFWYEILPGQKIHVNLEPKQEITGDNYYSPDGNESVVRFGYRYPRYVYLHGLAKKVDRARDFQQHYTITREGLTIKRDGNVTRHNALSFTPSTTQIYKGCADYTYTYSIKPKNAASRKPVVLEIRASLTQEGKVSYIDKNGKSGNYTDNAVTYARKQVTLNAKNNYTQTFPVTFKCVVEGEEGTAQHRSFFYGIPTGSSSWTRRLISVKPDMFFGGVYELTGQ